MSTVETLTTTISDHISAHKRNHQRHIIVTTPASSWMREIKANRVTQVDATSLHDTYPWGEHLVDGLNLSAYRAINNLLADAANAHRHPDLIKAHPSLYVEMHSGRVSPAAAFIEACAYSTRADATDPTAGIGDDLHAVGTALNAHHVTTAPNGPIFPLSRFATLAIVIPGRWATHLNDNPAPTWGAVAARYRTRAALAHIEHAALTQWQEEDVHITLDTTAMPNLTRYTPPDTRARVHGPDPLDKHLAEVLILTRGERVPVPQRHDKLTWHVTVPLPPPESEPANGTHASRGTRPARGIPRETPPELKPAQLNAAQLNQHLTTIRDHIEGASDAGNLTLKGPDGPITLDPVTRRHTRSVTATGRFDIEADGTANNIQLCATIGYSDAGPSTVTRLAVDRADRDKAPLPTEKSRAVKDTIGELARAHYAQHAPDWLLMWDHANIRDYGKEFCYQVDALTKSRDHAKAARVTRSAERVLRDLEKSLARTANHPQHPDPSRHDELLSAIRALRAHQLYYLSTLQPATATTPPSPTPSAA